MTPNEALRTTLERFASSGLTKRSHRCQGGYHHRQDVFAWFSRQGWRKLNEGMFAAVFTKPGWDQVLKVFSTEGSSGKATLAYLQAAKRCRNPMMPTVTQITILGTIAVVVMERLVSAHRRRKYSSAVAEGLGHFLEFHRRTPLKREHLCPISKAAEAAALFRFRDISNLSRQLRKAKSSTRGAGYDLHEDNVMLRPMPQTGGYQLVVTDPLA